MRIGEVSKLTNVSMRSLRYYEEKGLIHPKRLKNGYRDYDKLTLERIKTLKLYFDLGLTTAEMQQVMGCDPFVFLYKNLMCKDVIMIYEDKLKEVSHQIQILQQIESRLKERLMKIYHLKEDSINERY